MGKKYEPVPDSKRQELIYLIYEKGMNISKAAQKAKIYYPTAKAINKIYIRQNRICKKTNRDRTKKNIDVKIKVLDSETSTKKEIVPENDLLDYKFGHDAHNSTACETTRNDYSIHISPRGAIVSDVKI